MSKQKRLNAKDAEKLLLANGFVLVRTSGSHYIYRKGNKRVVIPFHGTEILHPKIVKQLYSALNID